MKKTTAMNFVCVLALAASVTSCLPEKSTGVDSPRSPDTTLGSLTVTPPVSVMAVGATQQLTFNMTSLTGAPLSGYDSVRLTRTVAGDSARYSISPTGLVTALSASTPGTPLLLNVFVFREGVVAADQVLFQITQTATPNLVLNIQPPAGDSTKLAAGSVKTITPSLRNVSTGAVVLTPPIKYLVKPEAINTVAVYRPFLQVQVPVSFAIQNTRSVTVAANQIGALAGEGSAWVYGSMNVYGTTLTDSVRYTFTYPLAATITSTKLALTVTSTLADQTVTLASGAVVTFSNGVAATDPLTMTYTFDNPSAAIAATPAPTAGGTTGNVTTLVGGQSSTRRFATPGTYRWTMTASGGPAPWNGKTLTGKILIK